MKLTYRLIVSTFAMILLLVGQSTVSYAQDIERIEEFVIDVDVRANGDVQIVETITYDFGDLERHGIFRELPIRDKLDSGDFWAHPIEVNSVTRNSDAEMYSENQDGYWTSLMIGDPNVFVSGLQIYKINYTVSGALFPLAEKDITKYPNLKAGDVSFYWDVIGNSWQVPIERVIVSVNLPSTNSSLVLAENCTFGIPGSDSQCSSLSSRRAWASNRALQPGESMTISMQMSPALFEVEILQVIDQGPIDVFSGAWIAAAKLYLLLGCVIGIAIFGTIVLFWRRRLSRLNNSRVLEVVRFDPPSGHVAEISAAWKGSVDARAITATLVDLAARGVVEIQVNEEKNLVVKQKEFELDLKNYEQDLLKTLFRSSSQVTIEGYDAELSGVAETISKNLVKIAEDSGVRNVSGSRSRNSFVIGLLLSAFFLAFSVATLGSPKIFGLLFPIALAMFIGFLLATVRTPRVETAESAEFLSHLLGFRKAMDTEAGALRRKFAQESGLAPGSIFATLLPLAIILELEDSWLANFVDLTLNEISSTGIQVSSISSLQHSIRQSHQVLLDAMTSPTSSGSGASGGNSGGGGGGGGGRSW